MHTVWKGAISFGLVHVPVKMFSATEDKDISMRMIHKECTTPLSYVRKCQHCDKEVDWEEIVKGYEYEPGRFVLFNKEELEALAGEANKEIKILDFVDLKEIDPIYFQKTYYLAPADTGANAYNLLLKSLQDTGKIGIAVVSIRSKSSMAAIRVVERCIVMETIYYPDEIRPVSQVPNLPEAANVNEKELMMAKMLIEQLTTPFDPSKYHDEYREAVMEAIQHKVAGEEIQAAPEQQKTNVIDLMAALQASLDAVGGGGAAGAGGAGAPAGARAGGAAGTAARTDAVAGAVPAGARAGGAAGTAARTDAVAGAVPAGARAGGAAGTAARTDAVAGAVPAGAESAAGAPAAARTRGRSTRSAAATAGAEVPEAAARAGAAPTQQPSAVDAAVTDTSKPKRGRPRKVKESV